MQSKDFIFNADATSLYPASMKGFDLVNVSYPIGTSRWSDKPEEEWNNSKIGFYKIKFTAPKNIRTPILPRKWEFGIRWTLEDGEGVIISGYSKCN